MARRIAGIDVGGTFTDLVMQDADGTIRIAKVPTTSANQAGGVLAAIEAAGTTPAALDLIVHGTTATTNAVLERKLAKVGLITTAGFRDVLELGRRTRPQRLWHDRVVRAADPARIAPRGGRTDGCARWRGDTARRGRRRARSPRAARPKAARRWSSISCTPMPIPRTKSAPARSPALSGRMAMSRSAMRCCRNSANTNAARRLP